MKTIKVQIIGGVTTKSAIMSGAEIALNQPLTFHAYSDQMKARILESMITNRNSVIENYRLARDITASAEEMKRISNNRVTIAVSFTDDEPRDGEWHEPLAPNALMMQ